MHQPQQVQRPAQAQIVLHHQPHVHQQQPQQTQVTSNNIGIIKTQQVPATIIGRNIIIPQQQPQQQTQQQQQQQQQANQQKISNAAIINLLNSAPAAMTSNPLISRTGGNITPQSQPTTQQVVQQLAAATASVNTANVDTSPQQSISNSNQSPNLLSLLQSPQIQIANARVISNNENNGNDTLTKILTIAAAGGNRTFIQGKVPSGIQTLQNMHIQIPGMPTPIQVTVTENGKVQPIPQTTQLNQQVNKMQMGSYDVFFCLLFKIVFTCLTKNKFPVPGSSHIAIQKNAINSTNLQASRGRNILVSTGRGITPTILTQRNIAGTIRTGAGPMQTQGWFLFFEKK